jgi:hypothetical protein
MKKYLVAEKPEPERQGGGKKSCGEAEGKNFFLPPEQLIEVFSSFTALESSFFLANACSLEPPRHAHPDQP